MYTLFRALLVALLKTPDGPPAPPTGDHGDVLIFRAAPAFYRYQLFVFVFRTLPGFLVSLVVIAAQAGARGVPNFAANVMIAMEVLAAAVLVAVVCFRYLLLRLDYDLRHYIVTDRSLRIRQGAWRVEESTFTFANVQNVTVEQGPIERLLGIANVKIETAGGGLVPGQQGRVSAHQGVLAGIEGAEGVRDRILARLRAYRDAGLGDHDDATAALGVPAAPISADAPIPSDPAEASAAALLRAVRDEAVRLAWAARGVARP